MIWPLCISSCPIPLFILYASHIRNWPSSSSLNLICCLLPQDFCTSYSLCLKCLLLLYSVNACFVLISQDQLLILSSPAIPLPGTREIDCLKLWHWVEVVVQVLGVLLSDIVWLQPSLYVGFAYLSHNFGLAQKYLTLPIWFKVIQASSSHRHFSESNAYHSEKLYNSETKKVLKTRTSQNNRQQN